MAFDPKAFFAPSGDEEPNDTVLVSDGDEETKAAEPTSESSEAAPAAPDPLLDEPASDDGDGEGADLLASEEDAEGDADGVPAGVQKRIDKLVWQREEARREAGELTDKLREADGKIAVAETAKTLVDKYYGEGVDASKMMAFDAAFMATLEKLSKQDVKVANFAKHIEKAIEESPVKPDRKPAEGAETSATTIDPAVNLIVEREARRLIDSALPSNVQPLFKSAFTDHLLAASDARTLVEGGEAAVLEQARAYAKAKALGKDDIYSNKAKAAPADDEPASPPTGGRSKSSRPTADKQKAAAAKASKPEQRPTRAEYEASRQARVDAFFGS